MHFKYVSLSLFFLCFSILYNIFKSNSIWHGMYHHTLYIHFFTKIQAEETKDACRKIYYNTLGVAKLFSVIELNSPSPRFGCQIVL